MLSADGGDGLRESSERGEEERDEGGALLRGEEGPGSLKDAAMVEVEV